MRRVQRMRHGKLATPDLTLPDTPTAPLESLESGSDFPSSTLNTTDFDFREPIFTTYELLDNLEWCSSNDAGDMFINGDDHTLSMWNDPKGSWDLFLNDANLNYSTNWSNTIFGPTDY